MIGRIRAAWDDSRRAANTRRGSNPMSREEWFELQDRIANLITGESLSIHLTDYRRHIERCIESQFRLHEAHTRSDEPLTRGDVEAIAVNAAGDLIVQAFLGSASPTAPETNSRTVTGVLRTDDSDGVVREWNPETYEHTATRRTGMTPILYDGPITRAEATAIGAEIKEKLDELLASKYAHTRPDTGAADGQGPDKGDNADRVGHIVATGLDDVFSRLFPKTSTETDDSFPDAPLDKFIAAQNTQTAKFAAEYQEFLRLRRPSADHGDTAARPDFTEVGAPDSSDAAQDRAFTEAVTARIAHDEHMLAIVHLFGLAMRGDTALRSAAYAFIAANPHVHLRLTDHAKQGGKCSVDDLGVRIVDDEIAGSGVAGSPDLGLKRSDTPLKSREGLHQESIGELGHRIGVGLSAAMLKCVDETVAEFGSDPELGRNSDRGVVREVGGLAHETSPSADGGGAHSVGAGEVTGVETAAPVTDATDSSEDEARCSAQVMLAGHVIDVTLTQNEYTGAVTMTFNLPDGPPVWRTMTLGELRLR